VDRSQRPLPASIPDAPGSYQFRDAEGRVIYVGKARSLRSRVSSYFQDQRALSPKTAQMLREAASVEWIQVANEPEAVMLEFSLIKEHRPRYNIQLRDDKSYPYLAVTVADRWPRPMVTRGARQKGVRYFGPYANAGAIRETLDLLVKSLPLRTCSDSKLARHEKSGKPCLLYHISRCSGPCVGAVDEATYREMVTEMCAFLEGASDELLASLQTEMEEAASLQDYERAAVLRDRLAAATAARERQQIVTPSTESFDVMGVHLGDAQAAVQVFRIRRGRVVGRRGMLLDYVAAPASMVEASDQEAPMDGDPLPRLVGHALGELYSDGRADIPREVCVPALPEDPSLYEKWLSSLRKGPVTLKVPKRGERRDLLTTVATNAKDELVRAVLHSGSDVKSRTEALEGLRVALGLRTPPLRIECYDMSHLQGSDYVGSMVVMEDGLPKKADYRHFRIRSVPGNDDYSAMREVLTRRCARLVSVGEKKGSGFEKFPDLIVVDGGKGQLRVASEVLEAFGIEKRVAAAALAKRLEEVFLPERAEPLVLARGSPELLLLQRVRDEAHRFALAYHRTLRGRRMVASALEEVEGLGPRRAARLMEELGGASGVVSASREQLRGLSWLPSRVADRIYERLHS
jgi:excinuclease ABC subunit C